MGNVAVEALDDAQLNLIRIENYNSMMVCVGKDPHGADPSTNFWHGKELQLLWFQYEICHEWHVVRGYDDDFLRKTYEIFWDCPTIDFESQKDDVDLA